MILILVFLLIMYLAYEKRCETKRVEAVSRMDWLTYEEIEKLIRKVKE